MGLLFAAPRSGGLVLPLTCTPALESATVLPLAFAIEHPANGLTAGGAAVARLTAARLHSRFIAPWPVTHRSRRKNFCCVTTRRPNVRRLWLLWQRGGALTARTFGLGVLGFGRIILPSFGLPPRRLPASHQTQAFGVLAVMLVPTLRLVLASTAFAQTDAHPRSSGTTVWLIMTTAHGSVFSQGTARGERANVLLGHLSKSRSHLYFRAEIRQARKRLEKGGAKETTKET